MVISNPYKSNHVPWRQLTHENCIFFCSNYSLGATEEWFLSIFIFSKFRCCPAHNVCNLVWPILLHILGSYIQWPFIVITQCPWVISRKKIAITLLHITKYRGTPDSTNLGPPGDRTIAKIVLNRDWFSTKIAIWDF